MHHSVPVSQVGFLPSMYSFCVPTSLPKFDLGPQTPPPHVQDFSNSNWETRCLRKHRRRVDEDVCSAKRIRLMETEVEPSDNCCPCPSLDWLGADSCSSVTPPQTCPAPQTPSPLPRPDTDVSCMEIEAAQRRLREIEDRITLEDDDEDLDVEPSPRRPVLVLSDSLKEGLQRGLSDILPHTVAQSVSHSCMELVLWRPPDDPFCRRLKGSLHKQRKQQQQGVSRQQPPTPCPSPAPPSPLGEEDMEM